MRKSAVALVFAAAAASLVSGCGQRSRTITTGDQQPTDSAAQVFARKVTCHDLAIKHVESLRRKPNVHVDLKHVCYSVTLNTCLCDLWTKEAPEPNDPRLPKVQPDRLLAEDVYSTVGWQVIDLLTFEALAGYSHNTGEDTERWKGATPEQQKEHHKRDEQDYEKFQADERQLLSKCARTD